jgi:ribonuclease BN (tRNA processing enzyme)
MGTLRVIGTSAAWHDSDEPASGFVIEHAGHALLLECGSGVVGRMNKMGIADVDDVLVTHAHADHSYDLVPLRYDYEFGNRQRPDQSRPTLHVTAETLRRLQLQVSAFTDDPSVWWDEGFEMRELKQQGQIGPWTVRTISVEHFIPAVAVRLDAPGISIVFSSDLGQGSIDELVDLADGCDVLLCEAALPSVCLPDHPARAGHLDPLQAASIAKRSGALSLWLTHVPALYDVDGAVQQARTIYPGARHARSGTQIEF